MLDIDEKTKEEIIEKTNTIHWSEIDIAGKHYYVKPDSLLKEVIGSYLAKIFGLVCAKYESVKIGIKSYSLSEDLKDLFPFTLGENYVSDNDSLMEIIFLLNGHNFYQENIRLEMLKLYVFDILFLNDDRRPNNWGIGTINNETHIVIIDNNNMFSVAKAPFIKYDPCLYAEGNNIKAMYADFEAFLNSLKSEEQEMIIDLITRCEPSVLFARIDSILVPYNEKLDYKYKMIYQEHFQALINIINKKRGRTI